jgi:hypothetical protein
MVAATASPCHASAQRWSLFDGLVECSYGCSWSRTDGILRLSRKLAPVEIHYSPSEDLERIDVALIGEAAKQIDMAAYVLSR